MNWVLVRGEERAEVGPCGAAVGYWVAGSPVLAGAEHPELFAFRGSLLAPWPNRVVAGRWHRDGSTQQLPINDPAAGSALHGLVYDVDWAGVQESPSSVTLTHALQPSPGYPFALHLMATYQLGQDGLACSLTAVNVGQHSAPVGLGVHPYVDALGLVDDLELLIPATALLQTDATWQETGRVPRQPAFQSLLGQEIDASYTGVVGREAQVRRPDGSEVTIWAGETCRWWVVYTGHTLPEPDYRRSVAVEPMTCPPNAFNTGEVDVLEPGEELRLDWGFSLR